MGKDRGRNGSRPAIRPGTRRPGVRDEVPQWRRRLRDFQVRGGSVAPHALRRALEIAPRPSSDGREASCTTKHAASQRLPFKGTLLTAGQWPVVTFQAVPGDRAGRRFSAARPTPGCLKMNSVHEQSPQAAKSGKAMPGASQRRHSRRLRASNAPSDFPPSATAENKDDTPKSAFPFQAFNSPGGDGGGFHVAKGGMGAIWKPATSRPS